MSYNVRTLCQDVRFESETRAPLHLLIPGQGHPFATEALSSRELMGAVARWGATEHVQGHALLEAGARNLRAEDLADLRARNPPFLKLFSG